MNKQTLLLFVHTDQTLQSIGITFLRISFGVVFTIFGYKKLMSSSSNLTQVGSAIGYFGIMWGHLWWGYLAALTEFFGGISYFLGFYTRLSSLPLIVLLIVAIQFHMSSGDNFTKWGFPLTCLCIVICFFIAGSGQYSLDNYIEKYLHTK
jgi:putative oxidoreductase